MHIYNVYLDTANFQTSLTHRNHDNGFVQITTAQKLQIFNYSFKTKSISDWNNQ